MNRIMIKCPECEGKTKTVEMARANTDEIYRKKECLSCGHKFYTVEFIVNATNDFLKSWHRCLGETNKTCYNGGSQI